MPKNKTISLFFMPRSLCGLLIAAALGGCAVGPAYERPEAASSAAWKELPTAPGWVPATPADAMARGEWWKLFGDPVLDQLAERVQVDNQNIAVAVAAYTQAQAAVREQRASLFPTVSLSASTRRSGQTGGGASGATGSSSAALGASWEPDLWGRLRASVSSAQAQAQASEADLAAARLSMLGSLAINYFSLREADVELATLSTTIDGYERSLTIARNRYEAAIAAQTDVLQAQTLLANARQQRAALMRDRATSEHAIAVLTGVPPANFSLPVAEWKPVVPIVSPGLPSELLQRRPDIAAAERAVAAANEQIGIQRSAYFPSFTFDASLGRSTTRWSDLFNASNALWSLGLSLTQVVFDAGAIGARVDQAKGAHEGAVASYRQTVLAAFQAVEDQLTALDSLAEQVAQSRAASAAADRTEQQTDNRYRAGQVNYTDVVVAQVSALNARRSVLQLQVAQQIAAIGLIQALGGGWQASWMAPQ
ncbi:efflux transporter outer membrane subunit [Variovorax dokdonensis]|uniref:Efflux transporter outer membrane subunit n=1 Tax=Variovorax dokdonensis TaxID=344883 RepID=A0ABT7NEW9_9BURK|nr:efflux transporter outer membrane subunit [Variovorax dokdonensis]MDM0046482.1 efflux transporter outer membrane subunit [Variovorax dokdonensis]